MFKKVVYFVFMITLLNVTTACAKEGSFSKSANNEVDAKKVEEIIENYFKEHPEFFGEIQQAYQKHQAKKRELEAQSLVKENIDELENDPQTPVFANPDGKFTIVEFFDYNCGFCRSMFEPIKKLVEQDKDIKWVMKDVAVLSKASEFAARMAIASNKMGKYKEFHEALMTYKSSLSRGAILHLAEKVGLDTAKLEDLADSKEVKEQLAKNMKLGRKMTMRGVPLFVVNGKIFRGAIDVKEIEALKEKSSK